MSIKDELIEGLLQVRRSIVGKVTSLPPERRDEVFLGEWSVKDLLAHLIGWDHTNVEAVKEILSGTTPGFCAFYDRDWTSYNAKLVREHTAESFSELLASLERFHQDLIGLLRSIPPEDFEKDYAVRSPLGGNTLTLADLLQTELDDERQHLQQIISGLGA